MRPIWPSDVISFEETGVLLSCLPDLGYRPRRLSQDRLASPEGSQQGLPFVSALARSQPMTPGQIQELGDEEHRDRQAHLKIASGWLTMVADP